MAKKIKAEVTGVAAPDVMKPRLFLSFEGKDVAQLKGLKVGDEAEFKVTGKIVGLSQRQRPHYKDESKTMQSGDVDLEGYRVQLMEDEPNEFTGMADDEEAE